MSSKKLSVGEIERQLNRLLRIELAESWDNVGLLVADRSHQVERIMLCIDLTAPVLREAQARRAEFVLAYHPPIFEPIRRVLADRQNVIYRAVRSQLAVYSVHTAFDAIPGGTSDVLADLIDLEDRKPIRPSSLSGKSKLVVFVPEDHVDRVAAAIFAAGGGIVGQYSRCSFRTAGKGTFLGSDQTHPTVGQAGKFEIAPEFRLEVIIDGDQAKLGHVVREMIRAHPYEEVAFDIYPLGQIAPDFGLGRIGSLARPKKLKSLITIIKRRTGLKNILLAAAGESQTIKTAAVCPGSCGKLGAEIAGNVDLYLTGELRHHDALMLQRCGTNVICLGHGNSERPALKALAETLKSNFPTLTIFTSTRDADPLTIV